MQDHLDDNWRAVGLDRKSVAFERLGAVHDVGRIEANLRELGFHRGRRDLVVAPRSDGKA
jgi:hypothetical protein